MTETLKQPNSGDYERGYVDGHHEATEDFLRIDKSRTDAALKDTAALIVILDCPKCGVCEDHRP